MVRSKGSSQRSKQIVAAQVVGLLSFLLCTTAHAQFETLGGPSFGASVKMLGMGGAFVAVADDSGAIIANPAGIARLPVREPELVAPTSVHLNARLNTGDERYFFLSYLKPGRENELSGALSAIYDEDDNAPGGRTRHFVGILSFAQTVGVVGEEALVSVGLNLKFHRQKIRAVGGGSDSDFTFDLGTLAELNPRTRVGLAIINATRPTFALGTTRKTDERITTIGFSHLFDERTLFALDVWDLENRTRPSRIGPRGSGIAVRVGVQRQISERFVGRIGFLDGRFTFGLGMKGFGLDINYGFADRPAGNDMHMLSLQYTF